MLLDRQRFVVKEKVAFLKKADTYDIFDADTQEQVGVAKEEPGGLVQVLRWFISKKLMPTKATMYDMENYAVFTIRKPVGILRERVNVFDDNEELVGYFKSKILSFGGGFWVYDKKHDKQVAEVKGKWTGWDFKFLTPDGEEIGLVSKKWAGLGRVFTSADNYIVSISDDLADHPTAKMLLLAATLAIDMVYYEQGS